MGFERKELVITEISSVPFSNYAAYYENVVRFAAESILYRLGRIVFGRQTFSIRIAPGPAEPSQRIKTFVQSIRPPAERTADGIKADVDVDFPP